MLEEKSNESTQVAGTIIDKYTRYDVFRSYLVENATYVGEDEIPIIKSSSKIIPNKVITFSKAMSTKDYNQWVVFYEMDYKFERIWNHPKKYLEILKRFNGVISPDFSLYRNMPLVMQKWSTYKGRALANYWTSNGIEVIPNVRFSDERSYSFCFNGIEKNSIIAIGTHGCIKKKDDKEYFKKGLRKLVKELQPKTIIVYGKAPNDIFEEYKNIIQIINFESDFSNHMKIGDDE